MKCPVPCWSCGELIELDKAHFNTDCCGCIDGCSHGICDECYEVLSGEAAEAGGGE